MFSAIYGITDLFPLYFAALALAIGLASVINGRLVMKFGMRLLSCVALVNMALLSIAFFLYAATVGGVPDLWLNMAYFIAAFLCIGFLFGNYNALAMEPLGHIAGVGAAVVGSISTLVSVPMDVFIGQMFDGTVLPLIGGFALLGSMAVALMYWTELGRRRDLTMKKSVP
jgi:DHA1 family bicyclomycin/chloramphenicol resistance-like MFS transporter